MKHRIAAWHENITDIAIFARDRVARGSINEKVMNESALGAYSFACKMIWLVKERERKRERETASYFRNIFDNHRDYFSLPLFFFSKRNIHAMRLYINNVFFLYRLIKLIELLILSIHFERSRSRMVSNKASKRFFKVD